MWQTETPDGRFLVVRRTENGWLATCLANRAEAPSAKEAIRQAIAAPLDGKVEELELWIAEHAAALEGVETS